MVNFKCITYVDTGLKFPFLKKRRLMVGLQIKKPSPFYGLTVSTHYPISSSFQQVGSVRPVITKPRSGPARVNKVKLLHQGPPFPPKSPEPPLSRSPLQFPCRGGKHYSWPFGPGTMGRSKHDTNQHGPARRPS